MKKKYLMLAGFLAACIVTSGCGKKEQETEVPATQDAQVTIAPTESATQIAETAAPTSTPAADMNLVSMQQGTKPSATPVKNEIGTKTATAARVQIINKTGKPIAQMYIRPYVEDGSWGEPLFTDNLKLNNNDLATYYCEKTTVNENGDNVSSYDIYIICADDDASEWYFRKLPLGNINSITLLIDGKEENAIPYATYTLQGDNKNVSTLKEVKKRMGLSDSNEETDQNNHSSDSQNHTENNSDENSNENSNVEFNDNLNGNYNGNSSEGQTEIYSDESNDARTYIGSSIGDLFEGMGEPESSSSDTDENGESGYYYYDGYTVSTMIDENGNEVVTGVW